MVTVNLSFAVTSSLFLILVLKIFFSFNSITPAIVLDIVHINKTLKNLSHSLSCSGVKTSIFVAIYTPSNETKTLSPLYNDDAFISLFLSFLKNIFNTK